MRGRWQWRGSAPLLAEDRERRHDAHSSGGCAPPRRPGNLPALLSCTSRGSRRGGTCRKGYVRSAWSAERKNERKGVDAPLVDALMAKRLVKDLGDLAELAEDVEVGRGALAPGRSRAADLLLVRPIPLESGHGREVLQGRDVGALRTGEREDVRTRPDGAQDVEVNKRTRALSHFGAEERPPEKTTRVFISRRRV